MDEIGFETSVIELSFHKFLQILKEHIIQELEPSSLEKYRSHIPQLLLLFVLIICIHFLLLLIALNEDSSVVKVLVSLVNF